MLVLGGAGFVGSNLCRRLLGHDVAAVRVIDNLLSAEAWNLPRDPRLAVIEGSAADDRVLRALADEHDFVFHLATFHGNQNSIARPLDDHEHNALPTLKLLERLRGFHKVQRVVYASAGCSLGDKSVGGATVSREDAPISLFFDSPYQISKILGELYGNYYFSKFGVPFVKARFQNVYGPGEILGAGAWRGTAATVWRNVVPTFVYRALKGVPLRVEGEGASRDFIFVDDIVEGLLRCALFGRAGEAYNLGTGMETEIVALARLVRDAAGGASAIEIGPHRAWDSSLRRYGATDKARSELGFSAKVDIADGVARTVTWTRDNLALIDAAIAKHAEAMQALGA